MNLNFLHGSITIICHGSTPIPTIGTTPYIDTKMVAVATNSVRAKHSCKDRSRAFNVPGDMLTQWHMLAVKKMGSLYVDSRSGRTLRAHVLQRADIKH